MSAATDLARTMDLAARGRAAVVIGTDGDGDRLVFGDAQGLLSAGIAAIPILSRERAAGGGGGREGAARRGGGPMRVLYDPKVNPLALSQWARLGVEPSLFRNGHSQIKERMRAIDAMAAVEESGHFYHRIDGGASPLYLESSLVTVLSFLRSVKERPSLMAELRRMQDSVFTTGEVNFQLVSDGARDEALSACLQCFRDDGADVISRTPDDVELMGFHVCKGIDPQTGALDAGWYQGYLRVATNEKAVLRSYVSAGDQKVGRGWENRIKEKLTARGGRMVD
jgi:phosphomannomutase